MPTRSEGVRHAQPFLQEANPLLIGSGNRCQRVKGSCFQPSDPAVETWAKAQRFQRQRILLSGICIKIFLSVAAASFVWFVLRRLEYRCRRPEVLSLAKRVSVYFGAMYIISLIDDHSRLRELITAVVVVVVR